ncbi:peroxiredoxin [bacterium]|nr:peroxiredoxin [bacterium]
MAHPGKKIPDFNLPATRCENLGTSDLSGKFCVIYFYPKDSTPGCTTETNDFTQLYAQFQQRGCEVVGFNHNPMKSHIKFEQKQKIPFPLVSDEEKTSLQNFDVWKQKKFMGREFMGVVRTTLLVGPDGVVLRRYDSVKVKDHAKQVLQDLAELQD